MIIDLNILCQDLISIEEDQMKFLHTIRRNLGHHIHNHLGNRDHKEGMKDQLMRMI